MSDQHQERWLSSGEACRLLSIKSATLYAYVSRGLVRSAPGTGPGRARLYDRSDLQRLKSRHDARSGHGAVAAGALRWGEPVLSSALTQITPEGPAYRGRLAIRAAAAGVAFEAVAERLMFGLESSASWPAIETATLRRAIPLLRSDTPLLLAPMLAIPTLAAADPDRFDAAPAAEERRARRLIRSIAASFALFRGKEALEKAAGAESVARVLLLALTGKSSRASEAAVDRALILVADHELNPSSFAARVAASTGADLYASLLAGLAALSGPKHGGESERLEALLAEVGRADTAKKVVRARAQRGDPFPGFGHRLYPGGDPRAPPMLEDARRSSARRPKLAVLEAVIAAMRESGREPPNLDAGLVAVSAALDLPPGAGAALFAVGRAAGWVAHVLEQRAAGFVLRPRAEYVGEPVGAS